jgi:hypothetical protein
MTPNLGNKPHPEPTHDRSLPWWAGAAASSRLQHPGRVLGRSLVAFIAATLPGKAAVLISSGAT